MIKWGILGLGNMAQEFSNAILETSNAKLIAVASLNSNRLNIFAKLNKIDVKYKFNSYESLLNCKDIDAVYISTLNNTHAELTIKAAQANKHILCEKPMAIKYEDVIKVFDQLEKSKVFFIVDTLKYIWSGQITELYFVFTLSIAILIAWPIPFCCFCINILNFIFLYCFKLVFNSFRFFLFEIIIIFFVKFKHLSIT